MNNRTSGAGGEWRQSWPVLIGAVAANGLTTVHIYGIGLFFQPLEKEFAWSRQEVSAVFILPSIIAFLLTPVFARLVDRYGARNLGIPAVIFYCLVTMSLALATSWIGSWWMLWALIGIGLSMTSQAVWSTGVASWFTRNRAMALAITLCGTGIGATLVPLETSWLITHYGWRGAFVGLGASGLVSVLPLVTLFFFDARFMPNSSRPSAIIKLTPTVEPTGFSVAAGCRSRYFYQLAFAAFAATAAIVGLIVHLVPMLGTQGIERATAVWLVGLVGIPSIIGRLTVGMLLDRFVGPVIGAIGISLPVISLVLLLLFPGSIPATVIAVLIFGLSIGGEYDAVIYLSTRFFGLKNFGTLFGFLAALISLGVGVGPAVGGFVFDHTGSYHLYIIVLLVTWALAGLSILTLGSYPNHAAPEKSPSPTSVGSPQVGTLS